MYDIITIGSATRDAFVEVPFGKIIKNKKFITNRGLCFSLGSKLEVQNIIFTTGGGATNTAVSLALQGFKVGTICKISNDISGQTILTELKKVGIDTQFVQIDNKIPTAYSIILTQKQTGERTILVFRGASEKIDEKLINLRKLKTKWFYIGPLAGNFRLLKKIFNFAHKNKINILYNPGSRELRTGLKKLRPFLKKVNILILNQEEAAYLTKIDYKKEKQIFQKLDKIVRNILIMTQGKRGVTVSDGKYFYRAGIPKSKVIDRTGAGDAFGSGFLSGFIRTNNINYAIQLATANSTSVIRFHGAKFGLLKRGQKFKKISVKKSII